MQSMDPLGCLFPGPGQSPLFRVGLSSDRLPFFFFFFFFMHDAPLQKFQCAENKETSLMMHNFVP